MDEVCPKLEQSTIRIGDISIRNNAFLAPMSGVTDVAFRQVAWRFGAGMVVSEMVASEAFTTGQEEMRLRAESAGLPIHMVQLAGRQPQWMREAVKIAEGSGADIVDINMGCPSKRVTNGYSGSALMRDLDHALTLIDAVVSTAKVPVTLKMRLGWDENSINAPELAARAERAGVQMITVHGRTRNQFYKGEANWDKIRPVSENISIPLVVNGDIGSIDDAKSAMQKSGAQAVMIGRASYGAPWIVGQIGKALAGDVVPTQPQGLALATLVAEHYDAILSLYGPELGCRNARKHFDWYCNHLTMDDDAIKTKKALMTCLDPKLAFHLIDCLFNRRAGVLDAA